MRLLMFFSILCLAACAASQNTNDIKTTDASTVSTPVEKDASIVTATPVKTEDNMVDKKTGVVDSSCQQDSDCAIKDIGSCCGYYPACVNKDSPTFPEQVKAECAKSGMMSTCGFPSISSCTCKDNKCQGVNGPAAEESLQ